MVRIKDTVHGYVVLDEFECSVVDSPWVQRLKSIRQNDVSSSVYPTMRSTRFEHSLGAMHVAGACMTAALGESASSEVSEFQTRLKAEWSQALEGWTRTNVDGAAKAPTAAPQAAEPSGDPAELAITLARLYGILHDIGHPPYSHLIERCISYAAITGVSNADAKKMQKWHELHSVEIVNTHLRPWLERERRAKSASDSDDWDKWLYVVVQFLRDKIDRGTKPALHAIKQLVDAVIDADRMDFVRRDGMTSGAEFGNYDVDRLVQSFRICIVKGRDFAEVFVRPSVKSLSAIESLLQERHKIYRWVHFHTRVMFTKTEFRWVFRLLTPTKAGGSAPGWLPAKLHLDAARFSAAAYFDLITDDRPLFLSDDYVDDMLANALKWTESKPTIPAEGQADFAQFRAVLRTLMLREQWGVALWKTRDDYDAFEHELRTALRTRGSESIRVPNEQDIIARYATTANWMAGAGREFVDQVAADLNAAAAKPSAPYRFMLEIADGFSTGADDQIVAFARDKSTVVKALGELSTVAQGIEVAWRGDVHLCAFVVATDRPWSHRADADKIREEARTLLATALATHFHRFGSWRTKLEGLLKPQKG